MRPFIHRTSLFAILLIISTFVLAADQPPHVSSEILTKQTMLTTSVWDYRLNDEGKLWLAYYDQSQQLYLRNPAGEERLQGEEGRLDQAPSGLAMMTFTDGASVLWRDKMPSKNLYLQDSTQPGHLLSLAEDTQPLARIQAALTSGNAAHILWLGEKFSATTKSRYNLYHRQWLRDTQTLSPLELVMPGIYPVMTTDETGGVMVYSWITREDKKYIAARYRPAATEKGFNDEVIVAETSTITPTFTGFRSGSRWFVLWQVRQDAPEQANRLEGAYSDDQGKTWNHLVFDGLRGVAIGSLQVATSDSGHILLVASAVPAQNQETTKDKQDLFIIRSNNRGATWSSAERIRHRSDMTDGQDAAISSLSNFHAKNPSVIFGKKPGQVLVVWEDWRAIRSSLYASLSDDYGATWKLHNVPLPLSPEKNVGLSASVNALSLSGDRFQIIAEEYTDDSLSTKHLVRLDLNENDLSVFAQAAKLKDATDIKDQESLLRDRVDSFWRAMKSGDYVTTYSLQDPFFRAKISLNSYSSKMGRIKYSDTQIESIRIDGNKAEVTAKIKASIPAFKVPSTGEIVSRPETEVTDISTWVQVNGEWFKEFRVESQDVVYTRY